MRRGSLGAELRPARRLHELAPAPIEAALVVLARRARDHLVDGAGQRESVILEAARLATEPHLVVVGVAAGDGGAARGWGVVSVFHVVLLGPTPPPPVADVIMP